MTPGAYPPDLKWIQRGVWAIAGVLWFLWIGYEDRSTTAVQLLSLILSLALALTGLSRWSQEKNLEARGWLVPMRGDWWLMNVSHPAMLTWGGFAR